MSSNKKANLQPFSLHRHSTIALSAKREAANRFKRFWYDLKMYQMKQSLAISKRTL